MATTLFQAHATHGIPLSMALMIQREKYGDNGSLLQFFFEAMTEGWTPEGAIATIEGACRDNELPFEEQGFKILSAAVWTKYGKGRDLIEGWRRCAQACEKGRLDQSEAE